MINLRRDCPWFALGVMLIVACGPTIVPPDQGGSGSSGDPSAETTAASTTPLPPPDPSTTTGADSTTTGDTGVDESSTSIGFINEPDFGGCLVVGPEPWHSCYECSLFDQDCPRGDKCMPWANDGGDRWNASRCSPIDDDPDAPGEPCTVEGSGLTGIDSCELGAMCWDVDPETLDGICVPMCSGSEENPQCPAPTECLLANDDYLPLCLPTCDPLSPECDPGDLCVPNFDRFFCMPPLENAPEGGPCEFFDGCAPGLVCAASDTVAPSCDQGVSGCCTPFCDLAAADPSAVCFEPGQECVFWWELEAPPGQENLGACVTPPP